MNAVHGPVVNAGRAEGATVATAVAQNPVHVEKIVAVFPNGSEHASVSAGMPVVQSERNNAYQLIVIVCLFIPLFPDHEKTLTGQILLFFQYSAVYKPPNIAYVDLCQAMREESAGKERTALIAFKSATE
jgi:hypothetical protein